MQAILSAVAHIHSRGYIHRDLKPENIVIYQRPDASFRLKIIDFGLTAVNKASNFQKITERCGTLIYMAPEQARQDHYGKPVDVWDHRADDTPQAHLPSHTQTQHFLFPECTIALSTRA